jgi:hypothetical protein
MCYNATGFFPKNCWQRNRRRMGEWRKVMKFAIIGTGIMGCGWIAQCAMTAHEVHCYDANPDILAGVRATCENLTLKAAKKFKIDDPDIGSNTDKNINVYEDKGNFIKAAGGCDIFLEVIFGTQYSRLLDKPPALSPDAGRHSPFGTG